MSTDRTGPCGSELNAVLGPLPEGREYIAGMNRHFAKVCGTVTAYSADDMRAYAAQEVAAERERWQTRVEQAFREGYWARETYNDSEVSDADEKWASAKAGLLRA